MPGEESTSVLDLIQGDWETRVIYLAGGVTQPPKSPLGRNSTSVQALGSSPMGWPAFMASPRRAAFMSRW